jgi:hypothetical protein
LRALVFCHAFVAVAELAYSLNWHPHTILSPASFVLLVSIQASFTTLSFSGKKSRHGEAQQFIERRCNSGFSQLEETPNMNLGFCCCCSRPSMQDVDKVAEQNETLNVSMLLSKQNFKLCPKCSLCLGFRILNFGLFIVSIAVHRSRIRIVMQQICCNLAA